MRSFDLKRYNEIQIQEIQRHKWIESEKAGRDLGQEAVFDWIRRYAASFRAAQLPVEEAAEGSSPTPTRLERLVAAFQGKSALRDSSRPEVEAGSAKPPSSGPPR